MDRLEIWGGSIMGFISTSVNMFVVGLVVQYWYRKSLRARRRDAKFLLGLFIILFTWLFQILVYYDIIPLPAFLSSIFPWIPAQSGRTWMWNSWQVFNFTGVIPLLVMPPGAGQIAIVLVLAYPLWFYLGSFLGHLLLGNRSHQRGIMWLLGPDKGQGKAPEK